MFHNYRVKLLVYLLGQRFFGRQAGLLGAVLCAFSPYLLTYQAESNTMMTFFALLGLVLFFEGLERKQPNLFVLGFVALGLATLIKTIALMIVVAMVLIAIIQRRDMPFWYLVVGLLFYGILVLPIISHNLILYHQKGILDMLFIRYFPVENNPYANLLDFGGLSIDKALLNINGLSLLGIGTDPLLSILGVVGIVLVIGTSWKRRQVHPSWKLFVVIAALSAFLLASSLMVKHYITTITLLCIFGGHVLDAKLLSEKFKILASVIFIAYSLVFVSPLFVKDPGIALDDLSELLPPHSFVVADSRIYRGAYLFPFAEHAIMGSMHFIEIEEFSLTRPPGDVVNTTIYFLECVPDDCTGAQSAKTNATVERMVESFIRHGEVIAQVPEDDPVYRLHKSSSLLVNDGKDHSWIVGNFFFHTIGWRYPQTIIDWYVPAPGWQQMLSTLSLIVLWTGLALVALGIITAIILWARIR